ncbi:NFACT RNA binding domain-containing protein [Ravibacter arvi]|uniref:NFACT RNA binding domain-containing protein n=1 Tax=Ravibacter arvi TaxID=2051041 RepID=A0ABP8M541_9BACT
MHLNYFFLRKLVPEISGKLAGARLSGAFSQDKDELIIAFSRNQAPDFTIRAILKTDFTSLFFPDKFERARANSVDLFKTLYEREITSVSPYENERAFSLNFETGDRLVFKLFGNRSNLLHFSPEGRLISLFNNRLTGDLILSEPGLNKPIDQSESRFIALGGDYKTMFPTFGKLVNRYLGEQLAGVEDLAAQWQIVETVLARLDDNRFYLTEYEGLTTLSLLPVGEVHEVFSSPIAAVNAFCLSYFRIGNLQREKERVTKQLLKQIRQTGNYLEAAYDKLGSISETGRNEHYANLIMANLHVIAPRSEFAELIDFYTGEPVRIRLKSELSAAKNAEAYFRKAKNEKLEIAQLQENIEAREAELALTQTRLETVARQETVKELRAYLKSDTSLNQSGAPNLSFESRFRKETCMGYQIFIGKSAKNNDELTLKLATKEDLWLHAKDVAGSHVVIKSIPGRKVPGPVIERAAELAAWHSKRRNDSLCPVTVTPKKFVRKAKGMAAGAVVVEKESVVMVVPRG